MPSELDPEGNTQAERQSSSLGPAPRNGSRVEKQIWAFRRYQGIGPDGRFVEEWTQQEIADALGVSRQTIDRWMNRETIASELVSASNRRQRWFLYSMIVVGHTDAAEEYLHLLDLENHGRSGSRITSPRSDCAKSNSRNSRSSGRRSTTGEGTSPDSDSRPFAGLDEDFSW